MVWKCKRCGECCNTPRLFKEDIRRIKAAGFKDFIYYDNLNNAYMKDRDGKCMFLSKGEVAACLIYDIRPTICRQYPTELRDGNCKPEELAFDRFLEKKNEKK